jgi:N-acetylglucosamine-6-phosphate deacetylase
MNYDKILCGRVVTPVQVIENGMVIVTNDRISYVGERDARLLKAYQNQGQVYEFNEPGDYLVPGFVDIHVHGGGGVWSYDDPQTFSMTHLRHGTTSILPTLVYNQSHQEMLDSLQRIQAVMGQELTPIVGIHMEGPYINPKYGAITSPIRPVDPEEFREILALAGKQIKVWTLAPELPGQQQFMEEASEYGIAFSVGHSEASPEVIFDAVPLGLRIGCHLTNASGTTPNLPKYAGTREIGVHEAVMLHDHMYAEVIPDREGIHVRPLMLRLILKTKGVDQVIIITDAADGAGVSAGRDVNMIRPNSHTPSDSEDEVLSGSLLTMDRAVHNMRLHTGIGWVDTAKLASLNAARVLGLDQELGSLEPGKKANILVVNESVQVKMVMLEGQIVHS